MKKRQKRRRFPKLLIPVLLLVVFGIWSSGILNLIGFGRDTFSVDGEVRVYCLDVGQGDSTLIRTGDGDFLIDAGTEASEQSLKQMLYSLGVSRIEALILTHPDGDHIGGADGVLSAFHVARLVLPEADAILDSDSDIDELFALAVRSGAEVVRVRAGDLLTGETCRFEFLGPVGRFYTNINCYSIVTRFWYGETSFLFPGDADATVETEMLAVYGSALKSDFLHVGHHGASTSTSQPFLFAVSPEFALISCGAGNTYGHPTSQTLTSLETAGVKYLRTDKEGSVVYVSDGKTVRRGNWLQ